MARNKTVSLIAGQVLENTLGLHHKNLADRNVTPKNNTGESLCYDFAEVIEKCNDLIHKATGSGDVDLDKEIEELNRLKRVEEIRKLRIDNDKEEEVLVPSSEVEKRYSRGIKEISDFLDPLVANVAMECPDISPAIKDSISRQLSELRNKITDEVLSG